jgi:cytochrome P450
VAAASILFQARDATAGLIGLALSAAAHPPRATAADLVERALRADPPVQWTSRTAALPVTIGGVSMPAGARVWILLAMADRGEPWPPATFGGGRHGCPGRLIATALARGVVAAILDGGWRPVPGQAPRYEPRPNLRIPVSVLMERS